MKTPRNIRQCLQANTCQKLGLNCLSNLLYCHCQFWKKLSVWTYYIQMIRWNDNICYVICSNFEAVFEVAWANIFWCFPFAVLNNFPMYIWCVTSLTSLISTVYNIIPNYESHNCLVYHFLLIWNISKVSSYIRVFRSIS